MNSASSRKSTVLLLLWVVLASVVLIAGLSVSVQEKDSSPTDTSAKVPQNCGYKCESDDDCGVNLWGNKLKCGDLNGTKRCYNPACTPSLNNVYCGCTGAECGDLCGPSANQTLCQPDPKTKGQTPAGEDMGCYLFDSEGCEFRCSPGVDVEQVEEGVCDNECSGDGCTYQQVATAGKTLDELDAACTGEPLGGDGTECPPIDSGGGANGEPDGKLTLVDFSAFAQVYRTECVTTTEEGCGSVDVNGDGKVGLIDFSNFILFYNTDSCSELLAI